MCEILWNDPHSGFGVLSSKRGIGYQFGEDITEAFLNRNKLKMLIRSHEMKNEGYEITHKVKYIINAGKMCYSF